MKLVLFSLAGEVLLAFPCRGGGQGGAEHPTPNLLLLTGIGPAMTPWFLCAFSIKCCGSLSCIIRSRDAGGWGTAQPSGRTNVPARLKSTEDICPSPANCESEHSSEQNRNPPSLCFASHRSRRSDEILGPSRPDKRFIFRLPFSITSAAGPAGWAVTSSAQCTHRPRCWRVLGCHGALPAPNLRSRTTCHCKTFASSHLRLPLTFCCCAASCRDFLQKRFSGQLSKKHLPRFSNFFQQTKYVGAL